MDKEEATKRLYHAAATGHIAEVQAALDAGADIEAADRSHTTALQRASSSGYRDIAELLISHGADVNTAEKMHRNTALHMAADAGHLAIVQLLVEHGADVNAEDDFSRTARRWAAKSGHGSVVEYLDSVAQKRHAERVTGDLLWKLKSEADARQRDHADRITEQRKDKGPPQVGG
jgi:ankyrin repeat protein